MLKLGRLSLFLAVSGMALSVVIGLLVGAVIISMDWQNRRAVIVQRSAALVASWERAASRAAFALDTSLAEEITTSMIESGVLLSVEIETDFGDLLARSERDMVERVHFLYAWSPLSFDFDTDAVAILRSPLDDRVVGELRVVYDQSTLINPFFGRVGSILVGAVINSLLVGLALVIVTYVAFAAPLARFVARLAQVDPGDPRPIGDAFPKRGMKTELGLLNRETDKLLESVQRLLQENKSARSKIETEERRFQDFATAASDWFWETDGAGRITYVSDRFEQITGISRASILNRGFSETFDSAADQATSKFKTVSDALANRAAFRDIPARMAASDGRILHLRVSGLPHVGPGGDVLGFRGVVDDDTKRHEIEQRHKMLDERVRHAEKLRSIGQLTGGVAHDFNNILAALMGNIELLQINGGFDAEAESLLASSMSAVQRGAGLTHKLLAYSRQQPLKPEKLDGRDLLKGIDDLLRRTLGERINLEVDLSSGLWACYADRDQLETVLINLSINARDAMPDGGRLTLEVYNARVDPEQASTDEMDAGQYVCFCRDGQWQRHGCGHVGQGDRAVLYNQRGRRGVRPGVVHGHGFCAAVQRSSQDLQ